jgi:hypothetical protein
MDRSGIRAKASDQGRLRHVVGVASAGSAKTPDLPMACRRSRVLSIAEMTAAEPANNPMSALETVSCQGAAL